MRLPRSMTVTEPLTFLRLLRQPDYFGLLVYLPPDPSVNA